MPSTEARIAGRLPQPVATKRTTNNSARATVVALICWPARGARTAVTAAMPPTATRYPALLVCSGLVTCLPLTNTSAILLQRAKAAIVGLWSTTTLDSAQLMLDIVALFRPRSWRWPPQLPILGQEGGEKTAC